MNIGCKQIRSHKKIEPSDGLALWELVKVSKNIAFSKKKTRQ